MVLYLLHIFRKCFYKNTTEGVLSSNQICLKYWEWFTVIFNGCLKTIDEVIKLVEQRVSVIQNNVNHIRQRFQKFEWTSAKRYRSYLWFTISTRFWIETTKNQCWKVGYRNINMLSCMTLILKTDVRQWTWIRNMVHKLYWHMLNLLLFKQLVECLAYYFTLKESAYPENTMKLE